MKDYKYIKLQNDNSNKIQNNGFNIIFKQLMLIVALIIISNIEIAHIRISKNNHSFNNSITFKTIELDYDNNTFVILKQNHCKICGLMAYYKHYLVCIINYLKLGYIPIIDLISFPNIFNAYNLSFLNINPWELFFYQPFGYTLNDVLENAKNIKYKECKFRRKMLSYYIFNNNILIYYWHNIATNYIPIKNMIINEANNIMNEFFKGSNNILGILVRGTDYIARRPRKHPITPNVEMVIEDIKLMEQKNQYDYFFIATEDDLIRDKIINKLGTKLKFIMQKKINYIFIIKLS